MTISATRRLTIEEFNALPEGPPNYEFEEGELILVPSPTITHQDIIDELTSTLKRSVRAQKLGRVFREVDVYLPDGRVLIPDLGFLAAGKLNQIGPLDGKIHGAPTLVVEVTSSDDARDRTHKFDVYFDNGVEWLWLVSQLLFIEEYKALPQGYVRVSSIAPGELFQPQLFPGLSINLAEMLNAGEAGEAASAESATQRADGLE